MSNNASGTFPQQTNQPRTDLMVQAKAPRGHGHGRKKKTKLVRVKPVVRNATRPMNCYIAYRSYYQHLFTSTQQKDISSFMGNVWKQDPFKGKWAIIAKAYSVLRDSLGKENAPLDKFFAIICDVMCIIEPTQYFVTMGWEITIAEDGEPFMHRNEKPINPIFFTAHFSVNDLICHCYSNGYFTGDLTAVLLPSNEPEMSMAATMQPTSSDTSPLPVVAETYDDSAANLTSHLDTEGLEYEDGALGMLDLEERVTGEADPTSGTYEVTREVTHETDTREVELATEDTDVSVPNSPTSGTHEVTREVTHETDTREVGLATEDTDVSVPNSPTSGTHEVTREVTHETDTREVELATEDTDVSVPNSPSAIEVSMTDAIAGAGVRDDAFEFQNAHFYLEGEYPFNEEFDPDKSATVSFDPFQGNQFDAFDVSEWDEFVDFGDFE